MNILARAAAHKLASQIVKEFEKKVLENDDNPADLQPKLLRGKYSRGVGKRNPDRIYTGRTPTTNLAPRASFGRVFDEHDSAARSSKNDFGAFSEYPYS